MNQFMFEDSLAQLAKYCHLSPNTARQLAHFHSEAHTFALEAIKSGIQQPPFNLCQQWHKQNNIPIDWDLYYRIKAKYSDNPTTPQPTTARKTYLTSDCGKQRMEQIKINNINNGTQKLKDDTQYAIQWIQFARKMIPEDTLHEIISQSSESIIDPIYIQLLKN